MDTEVSEKIITIVQLLARSADYRHLDPTRANVLVDNIEALIKLDGDEFVRKFLAAIREAKSLLSPNLQSKLSSYP
jgi:hypothetical protein